LEAWQTGAVLGRKTPKGREDRKEKRREKPVGGGGGQDLPVKQNSVPTKKASKKRHCDTAESQSPRHEEGGNNQIFEGEKG